MSLRSVGNSSFRRGVAHGNLGELDNTTAANIVSHRLYTDFDKFSLGTKFGYIFISIVVITTNILAMIVLRRTKKIPYASKLLCTGILSYDLCFVMISTIRKFIRDPTTNLAFQVVGSVSYHLSLISVMMMSVERFLLFYYPMRYLRIVTEELTRNVIFSLWALYIASFVLVRYGICYLKLKSMHVFVQAGVCNNIIVMHLGLCLIIVTAISSVCNWKVLRLIQSKKYRNSDGISLPSTSHLLRYYKSTGLVLTCLILLLLTSSAYGSILIAVRFLDLGVLKLRISFESISTINSFLDPILYIMWFKECQMEVLKLFAFFNRKLYSKAEEMRIEIFGIVVSDSCVRLKSSDSIV